MYHPTTRVMAVLALLRSHGRMTGTELARRLEVDARTLRRYITMLQDLGIPIEAERGRYGAYQLDSSYKLPPMMFTSDEALAVAVGLLAAQQIGPAEIKPAVESARAKLEQVLPPELKQQVRALTEGIALNVDSTREHPAGEAIRTLSEAVQQRQRVTLRYHSGQGTQTERDFDPYGLAWYLGKWYAVGRCHLRDDLRSFRLDRIASLRLTNTHFERPPSFDALAHMIQTIATMPRCFSFEILLKTDLATAQKQISEVLGVLEASADGVLFRGSVEGLDWLAQQLARLPFDFVIRSPDALRDELRSQAIRLINLTALRS